MSSNNPKTSAGRTSSDSDVESGWVATPATPPLYPAIAPLSAIPLSSSPGPSGALYGYPGAPQSSPYTYPQYQQQQNGANGQRLGQVPSQVQGPVTYVQPYGSLQVHVAGQPSVQIVQHGAHPHVVHSNQHYVVHPPSHGLAMAYKMPHPQTQQRSSNSSSSSSHSASPVLNASYSQPPPYATVVGPNHQQKGAPSSASPAAGAQDFSSAYPGSVSASQLVGKQQYLHKVAYNAPQVYFNPYNPYPAHPLWNNSQASHAHPQQPSPQQFQGAAPQGASSQHGSGYGVAYPQFSGDSHGKVQVGSSHLQASRAQEEYLRQIKALQSLYGYSSTASHDHEYAMPSSSYLKPSSAASVAPIAPIAPVVAIAPQSSAHSALAPEHEGERRANLTASVDVLLSSGASESFIEEQERILRECNAKKTIQSDEAMAKKLMEDEKAAASLLIDDEALFDELLRSENPKADVVSYPVLVVPEMVEELDEKLQQRIVDAQAFGRKARAFSHLETTLWNLSYKFKHLGASDLSTLSYAGSTANSKKEPTRKSYLTSSKGRREPLEESVGRDWQMMEDSMAPSAGGHNNNGGANGNGNASQNLLYNGEFSPGFTTMGRFQYPTNMVTIQPNMAYSVRPAQLTKDAEIEKSLYQDVVDLPQLQSFCLGYGVPKRVRALVWQLMMGYVPARSADRGRSLRASRISYYEMFDEFLSERHPLTKQDRSMFNLVLVDAPRTHPDGYHSLFNKPCVQASLERILYLWARKHPETSYFQGLNDLASVIMVVFLECTLPDLADVGQSGQEDLLEHLGLPSFESSFLASPVCNEALESALYCVEADAYHCLCVLLDSIKRFHIFSPGGVYSESMVVHFEEIVKRADPELHAHIVSNDLMFIQFAFRWMLCLFTRELETRNLICLWDSYIVENLGFSLFHIYVCAAYLLELRSQLLGNDMITMMGFLQRAPTGHFTKHDVHRLVQNAAELYSRQPLDLKPVAPQNAKK